MSDLFRIILISEDGQSTLKDGYRSHEQAEFVACKLSKDYGEGQGVYVEPYRPVYN